MGAAPSLPLPACLPTRPSHPQQPMGREVHLQESGKLFPGFRDETSGHCDTLPRPLAGSSAETDSPHHWPSQGRVPCCRCHCPVGAPTWVSQGLATSPGRDASGGPPAPGLPAPPRLPWHLHSSCCYHLPAPQGPPKSTPCSLSSDVGGSDVGASGSVPSPGHT